jgi:hypothetical protein
MSIKAARFRAGRTQPACATKRFNKIPQQLNPTTTQPKNNLTQRLLNSLKNERQRMKR